MTTKKSLMDFVAAGRRTGSDLAKQRNPVEMAPSVTREEVERMLAEAEEKMNGPLWEREFAATAIRSLDRAIDQTLRVSDDRLRGDRPHGQGEPARGRAGQESAAGPSHPGSRALRLRNVHCSSSLGATFKQGS